MIEDHSTDIAERRARGPAAPDAGAKSLVLLTEHEETLARLYADCLQENGLEVVTVRSGPSALDVLQRSRPKLVVLNLELPGIDPLQFLARLGLETTAVVTTSNASLMTAVRAVRAGAYDYLVKPFSTERLVGAVRAALLHRRPHRDEGPRLQCEQNPRLIGSSAVIRDVSRIIESASASKATVFITGESGTGKEVCAQLVHRTSNRSGKPFVAINCGALPHSLVETEIFGHVKGAFTGATHDRPGAAIQANGGTLFLDEICELDLVLQSKLLRFVQEGRVRRVGASSDEKVDVRIVCATNRDPMNEVKAGRFREDLYYRLHVIPIRLPPLRERDGDAVEIARALLLDYAREEGKAFRSLAPCAERAIRDYPWPGNVRQLQNVLRSAVVFHDGVELTAAALPELHHPSPEIAGKIVPCAAEADRPAVCPVPVQHGSTSIKPLAQLEQEAIESAMRAYGNNISLAAAALGISPSTIYRKRQAWSTTK